MKKSRFLLWGTVALFVIACLLLHSGMKKQELAEVTREAIILYTNDVHCAVSGYPVLSAYRQQMLDAGFDVAVIDAGDNVKGKGIGTLGGAMVIPKLMNAVPYDLSVPGNHEFDYGMGGFFDLLKSMKYAEISLNFEDVKTGRPVLDAYKIIDLGGRRIAFLGVCTPRSSSKCFKDPDGNQLYDFSESTFYEKVQLAVDDVRAQGADLVILVSHLGMELKGKELKWSAKSVITATKGIDAVIDGHSHEVFAEEWYKNADGKAVLYTQTGTGFMFFGKMTISKDGTIHTELINPSDVNFNASEASKKAYDDLQTIIGVKQ